MIVVEDYFVAGLRASLEEKRNRRCGRDHDLLKGTTGGYMQCTSTGMTRLTSHADAGSVQRDRLDCLAKGILTIYTRLPGLPHY